MRIRRLLVFMLAFAPATALAQSVELKVVDYACARQIVDRMPVEEIDCGTFDLPGPVYVWVRLRGGPAALGLLESGSGIVIRHKWLRFVGPNPDIETIDADEEIRAGTIDATLLSRLRQEVNTRGYFDWRTWSYKRNVRKSRYAVLVLDRAYLTIPCDGSAGGSSECSLKLTVREK